MSSRVVAGRLPDGTVVGAAWLRTLRRTGRSVYGGGRHGQPRRTCSVGARRLSAARWPSDGVAASRERASGNLRLVSDRGAFGSPGAYLFVRDGDGPRGWARRIPIVERFDVYIDDEGVLRCDHELRFGPLRALQLHYKLTPEA